MASYVLDGLVLPVAIAGHPALDFCNTRAGWGGPAPKEYLHSHAHLALWAREHGLATPAEVTRLRRAARRDPAAAAAVVARAIAFRSALYALLVGPSGRGDWARVNTETRAANASALLVPAAKPAAKPAAEPAAEPAAKAAAKAEGALAGWELSGSSLDRPLLAVAFAAAQLLTAPGATQVRACPGEGCGWIFADPRGRRRWCSMAWCGNRAKARRHAGRLLRHRRPDGTDAGTGEGI